MKTRHPQLTQAEAIAAAIATTPRERKAITAQIMRVVMEFNGTIAGYTKPKQESRT